MSFLFRPGYVMATLYDGDVSRLNSMEKLLYRLSGLVGGYRRSCRERWLYMRRATLELYQEGFRDFLVPGAGLPTGGHVHQLLPDARVLYLDREPSIVEEARKLVGDNPNVRYVQGDLGKWGEVQELCDDFFGPEPRIGIIFIGATYFLPDQELKSLFQSLYNWAAPGSKMITDRAYFWFEFNPVIRFLRYISYTLSGNVLYFREPEHFESLVKPWRVEKTEPIIFFFPRSWGFRLVAKTFDELTEDERTKPPVAAGYKLYKPG